ncbi:MAG TPA: ribonuclease HI family protein [Sedimentisphaerales bacterium]|nr:ribonuclease HI family protein [Sedimentisphaerales bacterium]
MKQSNKHIVIYTDGGSRPNPGPSAAGFTLTDRYGVQLLVKGKYIGYATCNEAEYRGAIEALKAARGLGAESVHLFSDSELLIKQINGEYRVKNKSLIELHRQVNKLLSSFKSWKVDHIYREENTIADSVVGKAILSRSDVILLDNRMAFVTSCVG